MTSSKMEDTMRRGELLVHLRHGVRHSSRLAEQLVADSIVGCEARALLCRLRKIRDELEHMSLTASDQRFAVNDPFWSKDAPAFRQGGAS